MTAVLRWLNRLAVGVIALLLSAYLVLWWITRTASVSTHGSVDPGEGNITIPSERTRSWAERSAATDSLIAHWASLEVGDWQADGKVGIPRILLGKLASGKDIEFVNAYLQERQPRGTVGSTGPFHPNGDYDFTLAGLTLILHAFGNQPDLLYPKTTDHIVNVLMTEEGGTPKVHTPRILGLPLRDTENHILMTEGSRYLKNRWKALHGDTEPKYNNETNGLEAWLLNYMAGIERAGLYEYNSIPYDGYTLTALLNLEAFAAEPVRMAARRILDRCNWDYALGSLSFRRFPPFRRQPQQAQATGLDAHYHTIIMKAWMSLAGIEGLTIKEGKHHALWVPLTSYRPPDAVVEWVLKKPTHYFIQMGHGRDGSPEIYSGGPGYLITAGGVSNDWARQCVARPTTLMLEDGAMDLKDVLHVAGPGDKYREWNNTGVHENFAVAAGPVSIPAGWKPVAENNTWRIFKSADRHIAVHSSDELGIFCLLPDGKAGNLLAQLTAANADAKALGKRFQWPQGPAITYDVHAPKTQWVIVLVDGKPVDRDHGKWPLMQGKLPGWSR